MPSDAQRREWIERVLGVSGFAAGPGALRQAAGTAAPAAAARMLPAARGASGVEAGDQATAASRAREAWDAGLAEARACSAAHMAEVAKSFPAQAAGLRNVLDSYWRDLATALDAPHEGDAIEAIIQALRAEMSADRLLTHLESNRIPVRPAFLSALRQVELAMSSQPPTGAQRR